MLGGLQNRVEKQLFMVKLKNKTSSHHTIATAAYAQLLHSATYLVDAESNAKVCHSHLLLSPAVLLHESNQD